MFNESLTFQAAHYLHPVHPEFQKLLVNSSSSSTQLVDQEKIVFSYRHDEQIII
jgi:hypothetical protein